MHGHLICTILAAAGRCVSQAGCHPGATPGAAKDPMATPHDCTAALPALASGNHTQ